ncbi:MAG: hypothetical protein AB7N76_16295 [Planctomycetota bacterium]
MRRPLVPTFLLLLAGGCASPLTPPELEPPLAPAAPGPLQAGVATRDFTPDLAASVVGAGQWIGSYQVRAELARGAVGVVFEGARGGPRRARTPGRGGALRP